MAVEYSCQQCEKPLMGSFQPGKAVICTHCGNMTIVLAHVTGAAGSTLSGHSRSTSRRRFDFARAAPWAISIAFHVLIAVIMAMVAMYVIDDRIPEHVTIPSLFMTDEPGGAMAASPYDLTSPQGKQPSHTKVQAQAPRESVIPSEVSTNDESIDLIGSDAGGAEGGALTPLGLEGQGAMAGQKSTFFGQGGNAHHIVFVIDRSGSMAFGQFEWVRREMLRSISRLRTPQDFHVIMFAHNQVIENTRKELVSATMKNKEGVADFLTGVVAEGTTTALPALKRAFEVLDSANDLPGKLIYLLSDGDFKGGSGGSRYKSGGRVLEGNAAVVRWLADKNRHGEIQINTYLFGDDAPKAVEVMKRIAKDNGGRYRYVSSED